MWVICNSGYEEYYITFAITPFCVSVYWLVVASTVSERAWVITIGDFQMVAQYVRSTPSVSERSNTMANAMCNKTHFHCSPIEDREQTDCGKDWRTNSQAQTAWELFLPAEKERRKKERELENYQQ